MRLFAHCPLDVYRNAQKNASCYFVEYLGRWPVALSACSTDRDVAGASATFKTYQPHEYVESCEALAATPSLKRNVDLGIKLDILNLAYPAQSDVVTVTFAQTTLIEIRSVQIFDCRIDLPQIETTLAMATFSMQPGAKHKLIERGNDVWYLERLN